MDILLTHGYFLQEDPHELAVMKPYPPLGLLYISSHLKAEGFSVDLYDSTFRTWSDFEAYIDVAKPSVTGIYTNLMTKQTVLRMTRLLREKGAWVILGGPEPAYYAEEYLDHGASIIVIGEGEFTLTELIPHLARYGRVGLENVKGITFRNDEGRTISTDARPQIQDLSAQPWPDRESIDLDRYLTTWETYHGVRSTSIIMARGCPFTCTWCSHSVFGETHRRRTVEDASSEVDFLVDRYKPDQLWYADDVFTINKRWLLSYADELKRRNLHLPFECISRADRIDSTVASALAEMGCSRLWIGAESGSQTILDAMKRRTDVDDVQAKTHLLQSLGIEVGMFIMLGYDGEEFHDIEATAELLKRASPDVYLTTVAYPIKGTAYYKSVSDRIYTDKPWDERTDRDLGVSGRFSSRFYEHATRWMVNDVSYHRMRTTGSRNYAYMAKLLANRWRGRIGMRLTRNQREEGSGSSSSGRGWSSQDRTVDGW